MATPETASIISDTETRHSERLRTLLNNRTAKVAVLGMGYVGLPMAVEFTRAGLHVIGIDVDPERCASLAQGRSYISDLSDEELKFALQEGRFVPTTDLKTLAEADALLICVPTPLRKSKDPDLTAILAATNAVKEYLRPGQLIVLESTTYPGTTEEILLPILSETGLEVGKDFFLAFSPERVDPGNPNFSVKNITKLVGGVTPTCTQLAETLYRQLVEKVVPVSNPRVAEAAKLLENTFRSVNIGLANEMSIICRHLNVDVWEVINAAATKPFGFMAHYPGPGIGGHCIPLDPHYLSWKARLSGYEPRFISLASDINGSMPHHVLDLVTDALNDHSRSVRGSRILVMGVAYKPGVGDCRESPALEILEMLHERGASLSYSDPYVPSVAVGDLLLQHKELSPEGVRSMDVVLVLTNHPGFDYEMIVKEANLVIDTRNAVRPYLGEANKNKVRFI
ncbi:MAG: nucleotide sugar dehydrogenase [Armatimonadetes bacterium]|nr:nucleotide sugar dehydrogenase [Armatimonadota bacterium]